MRLVSGDDGREVIQMRIDMGVLQLETSGRPDGTHPEGHETYFDYLLAQSFHTPEDFELDEEQCSEADREFVQFYHRRICWLALREYSNAVEDANHTLGLMDFCRDHSSDEDWTLSHEQYRPFVMFHRAHARALAKLDEDGAEAAVQSINQDLEGFQELYDEVGNDDSEDELVARLTDLRETLRERFEVGRTLLEQLDDAIASEEYELAAKLRDKLSKGEQSS